MKCYVIAQVMRDYKTLVGYKLLDADSGETMVVNLDSMKTVLRKQPDFIKNVALINDTLTGTNGKLDRYAKVDTQGNLLPNEKSPLVVLNRLGDVGYTVVDFKGQIVKMPTAKVVEYAKNQGIANGKVVEQDNVEFISSISDSYEVVNIAPSKVGANVRVNIPIRMGTDTASIAKHTAEDIQTEMEYNDVFQAMTPEQRGVLKQYYTWYTVDAYKKLAKNVRLSLAPGKAEKLAQLRGIDKWQFAGINDSYMEGNFKAHCELGHRLRYEYFAIPEDALDDMGEIRTREKVTGMRARRDTVQDLRDAGAIVFGETCAGDFFNIAPEDMKKLVKTRKTMSDEIELMSEILTNHLEFNYTKKYTLLTQIINKLGNSENVIKVFGERVGFTILAFMKAKMPFPMSLVILAGEQARNNIEAFWSGVLPEKKEIISKICNATTSDATGLQAARQLLWFISEYSIEGEYQYNPVEDQEGIRKDIGRYNKETREERSAQITSLINGTSVNVRFATLENIESYLCNVEFMVSMCKKLLKLHSESLISVFSTLETLKNGLTSLGEAKRYQDYELSDDEINNIAFITSSLMFSSKFNDDFFISRELGKHYYSFRNKVFMKASIYSYRARFEAWKNVTEIHEFAKSIATKYLGDIDKYVRETLSFIVKQAEIDKVRDRFISFNIVERSEQDKIDRCAVAKLDYITYAELMKAVQSNNETYGINYNDIDGVSSLIKVGNLADVREISERSYDSFLEYIRDNRLAEKRRQEVERARKQKEDEELARLAEQQRLEREAAAKKEMEEEAKLDKLKGLLDECPSDLAKSYGVQTARAILSSGLIYSKMSPKQKWRIDKTLQELEELKNKEDKTEDEIDYDLDSVVVDKLGITSETPVNSGSTSTPSDNAPVKQTVADLKQVIASNSSDNPDKKQDNQESKLERLVNSQANTSKQEDGTTVEESSNTTGMIGTPGGNMFDLFSSIPTSESEEEPTLKKEDETNSGVDEQKVETPVAAQTSDKTSLDSDPALKAMVDTILSKVNIRKETDGDLRFSAQVALTVSKRGTCSEKQRKYIENGFLKLS